MGINQDGVIEIISGLEENEIVALDGAAYLTDQTPLIFQLHKYDIT